MSDAYHLGTVVELRAVLGTHPTTLLASARAGAATLVIANTAAYQASDGVVIDPGQPDEELRVVQSVAGHAVTLTAPLELAHQAGSAIERSGSGTVTITVRLPDGTTATPTVSAAAAPLYTATYTTTQAGRHVWQASASGGAYAAVSERSFDVLTGEV